MSFETIRLRLNARPFQPFRIVTSSGESYDVRHPEMTIVTKAEIVVASSVRHGSCVSHPLIAGLMRVCRVRNTDSLARGSGLDGNESPD